MIESLLDRKLGDIVARVINAQVAGHFSGLRDEIAALKVEIIATAAANSQQLALNQASINELKSLLPGSQPSTQSSGTTLSAAAELRSQPIPDADYAAYCNPYRPNGDADDFDADVMGGWSENEEWPYQAARQRNNDGSPSRQHAPPIRVLPDTQHPNDPAETVAQHAAAATSGSGTNRLQPAAWHPPIMSAVAGWITDPLHPTYPIGLQQQQTALMPCATAHTPTMQCWTDLNAPALHRQHNPKQCMVCRGSFQKLSSCKEHMLKCLNVNAGCRFLTNCDHHQQLIRPFSGPTVEVRWMSAVSEWIHRKA